MIISDRISAFECLWRGEGGLEGIPGKGAALNTIAAHWFGEFHKAHLGASHIIDMPHPLVWIVQRARPVMIEAIARRHITGSMWRAYEAGARSFCGVDLPEGLERNQRLESLLLTPSTKGVLRGIPGVPEADDVNVDRAVLEQYWQQFGFRSAEDVATYETMLCSGFELIEEQLAQIGHIFVDTKFEFGYVTQADGSEQLIYMDEVGTPDSSRIWEAERFAKGQVTELSKEHFRQALLALAPDPDILTNKDRMAERSQFARQTVLPRRLMEEVSTTYIHLAEQLTGRRLQVAQRPREEVMDCLATLGLLH
jgi:phosphoribosylaminoimidazole-succinocarboxamide synthase